MLETRERPYRLVRRQASESRTVVRWEQYALGDQSR